MTQIHTTNAFAITESGNDLEIWVDWVPAVDGTPALPVQARIDGDTLVIEPIGPSLDSRKPRRVVGIDPGLLEEIRHGFTWYISGPSGVLGRHRLTPV